ncbi:hypothetical protein Trichorick_01572 (plasmid) [Candidatus Trichorickettsia mobilis]|uniref:hypothetical protein n=1 Tax=Candidatus Trichorickettsia mobilis TaxID=1346319 RepID=UPI002B25AE9A|nr:hypothetical protein [Candidatus Trichorickettsia mobilis]WPY01654.1 hypothetical protein Trichorick_01572 [Candidatus Trichorickettsia mobilis]
MIKQFLKKDIIASTICLFILSLIIGISFYYYEYNRFNKDLIHRKNCLLNSFFKLLADDFIKLKYSMENHSDKNKHQLVVYDLSYIKNYKCLSKKHDNENDFILEEPIKDIKQLIWNHRNSNLSCIIDVNLLNKEFKRFDHNVNQISYYLEVQDKLLPEFIKIPINFIQDNHTQLILEQKIKILTDVYLVFGYQNSFIILEKSKIIKSSILLTLIVFVIVNLTYFFLRRALLYSLYNDISSSRKAIKKELEELIPKHRQLEDQLNNIKEETKILRSITHNVFVQLKHELNTINKIAVHLDSFQEQTKHDWLLKQIINISYRNSDKLIKVYQEEIIEIKKFINTGLSIFAQQIKNKNIVVSLEINQVLIDSDVSKVAFQQIIYSVLRLVITRLLKNDELFISLNKIDNLYILYIEDNSLNDIIVPVASDEIFFLGMDDLQKLLDFYHIKYISIKEKNLNKIKLHIPFKQVSKYSDKKTPSNNNVINLRDYANDV